MASSDSDSGCPSSDEKMSESRSIIFYVASQLSLFRKNGLAIFIVIMLVVSAGVAALCAFVLKVRPLYSVGSAIGAFIFTIILAVDVQVSLILLSNTTLNFNLNYLIAIS